MERNPKSGNKHKIFHLENQKHVTTVHRGSTGGCDFEKQLYKYNLFISLCTFSRVVCSDQDEITFNSRCEVSTAPPGGHLSVKKLAVRNTLTSGVLVNIKNISMSMSVTVNCLCSRFLSSNCSLQ